MADNQETPDVSARDIAELLGRFDVTLADFGKRLEALGAAVLRVEAQASTNGKGLTELKREATTHAEQLGSAHELLGEIHATVKEAAPLLNSRAAKALKAGGTVLDYMRAGGGKRAGG